MSKSKHPEGDAPHTIPTGWTDTVFICRKCSRKLNGGFGEDGKETLRQAIRGVLRETGRRGEVGLIETRCLGVCPKRAVTMMRASEPGSFRVIPVGTRAGYLA